MTRESELRSEICEIGRRVYDRFFVAANDGNISARLDEATILVTPTGVSKGLMQPEDILKVGMDGRVLQGSSGKRPSSETPMHIAVYQARPDVLAAVHAHPPTATGFGVAGLALDEPILPEMILTVGWVPLVPYGTPAGVDLQDSVAPYLNDYDAFLLANHGALTLGESLTSAYFRMESLELYARVWLTARSIGNVNRLSEADIERLMETREKLGGRGRNPYADSRRRLE